MIVKRITAHILNKAIIFIPAILLLGGISFVISPNYFLFGKDATGWLMVSLYKYLIFLPAVFIDLVKLPSEFLEILKIISPALTCFVIIEIASIKVPPNVKTRICI